MFCGFDLYKYNLTQLCPHAEEVNRVDLPERSSHQKVLQIAVPYQISHKTILSLSVCDVVFFKSVSKLEKHYFSHWPCCSWCKTVIDYL